MLTLDKFLSEEKLKPPRIYGFDNYLKAMKKPAFLNTTSHNNPDKNVTSDDLRNAWRDFLQFISHFKCQYCGKGLGRKQNEKIKCKSCGEEFSFASQSE